MLGILLSLCCLVHVHVGWAGGQPAFFPQFVAATDGWYWPVPTTFDQCWCYEGNDIWLYDEPGSSGVTGHTYDAAGHVLVQIFDIPNDNAALWAIISHEIVEAEIDPYGGYYEAADQCPWFTSGGIWLTEYRHSEYAPCSP